MPPTHGPLADAERERLKLLHSYAVLDTPSEDAFDRIAQEAARVFEAPSSAITLVAENRCWFKARVGIEARELPRDFSICGYAFRSSGIFVVPDASLDERFKHLPLIAEAGFRFYAGVPLITPDGHSLGTLCVLDRKSVSPLPRQLDALRALATRVMALLEIRQRDLAPAASVSLSETPSANVVGPIQIAPPTFATAATRDLVLVVDDEELIRGVTAAMITRLGCETRLAANGQEALERIAALEGRVRLVLTDLHMPVMNGLDLARALRRQPNAPAIAVMSGKFTPENRAELHALGITNLVSKPFGMAEIEGALKNARSVAR